MKTKWFTQRFHENLIRGETEKAIIIQVPSTCRLGRWKFYHPAKLTTLYTTILEIRFSESWNFTLYRGKEKQTLSADEFIEMMKTYGEPEPAYSKGFREVEHPTKLTPVARKEIPDELINS